MTIGDSRLSSKTLFFFRILGDLELEPRRADSTRHVEERVLSCGRNMRWTRSPFDMMESWLPTLAISRLCTLSAATLSRSLLKFALTYFEGANRFLG